MSVPSQMKFTQVKDTKEKKKYAVNGQNKTKNSIRLALCDKRFSLITTDVLNSPKFLSKSSIDR